MREYTTFPPIRHRPDIVQALAEHEGVVRRQWLGDLPYAGVLHAGRIGLWRYDPTRGTAFSTHTVPAIARPVWRAVAQAQPHS